MTIAFSDEKVVFELPLFLGSGMLWRELRENNVILGNCRKCNMRKA